jgi:glycosyltransferase involved in cell wall biosynthesis
MNGNQSTSAQVVASFPPPTVGQALVTERIIEELRRHGHVKTYDWLPNSSYGSVQRMRKAMLSLAAPLWVVWNRLRGHKTLYSVANAGVGMYYNLFTLFVARLVGCRCILHHHAVSYLVRENTCMRWVARLMGKRDLHVVLGPEMKTMLEQTYASDSEIKILTNGFIVDDVCADGLAIHNTSNRTLEPRRQPRALGHLSNLCHGKGLDIVLDTFRRLLLEFPKLKLILAGPAFTVEAERLVRDAQVEFRSQLDYRGPVYGDDKTKFFEMIDIMLYPTRDDAQPLVLLESLAHGKPSIATAIGCIPSLVDTPEWIVERPDCFFTHTAGLLRHWTREPAAFTAAIERSRFVAARACQQSQHQLAEFCRTVFQEAA